MALPLLLFTLSGVVALIYQVSWTRMLYPAFGMQLSAITAVVATFLAGLGLGSRLFGPMADRTNPWKLYAGLEIGIGLWGLAMPSLTGAAVSIAGLVSFVGLVSPHISRTFVGDDYRYLVPASALTGAVLVTSADLIARLVIRPAELPMGILTAAVGAPFLLYLVRFRR